MSELEIVKIVNNFGQGTFIDSFSKVFSAIPFMIVLWTTFVVLALFLDKKAGKKIFWAVLVGMIIYFIINDKLFKYGLLEYFPERLRPYLIDSTIKTVGTKFHDSSFPSGHMSNTAIVMTIFTYYYRKLWLPALVILTLMAFTRLHNGMHFPSDVLAGLVLGIGYGLLAIYFVKKISEYLKKRKAPSTC